MASVFLSYSREDLDSARPIALALEEGGHSVWWDRRIKGGAQYAKEIDQALTAADVVVVLWSADSIESAWVRDEAEAGRDTGRLVPVCLDGSRPPLGFRQFQTIDLTGWRRSHDPAELDALLGALGSAPEQGQAGPAPAKRFKPRGRPATRRKVLVGGGAAAAVAAAGGLFIYSRTTHSHISPEVQALMTQASILEDQNTDVAQKQAVGLYERAVKLAPDFADGWGRLGVILAVQSHYSERPQALPLRARAQSAGRRALELDPQSVYGELALAISQPFIGHWSEWDRRLTRALRLQPRNDDVLTYRAVMLQFEGRPAQSVPIYQRIEKRPFSPAVYTNYIRALWSAGRLVELDDAMQDAASLYPTQGTIWSTRYDVLTYSGRADEAIALAQDREERPTGVRDEDVATLIDLTRAIQSRDAGKVNAVMVDQMKFAREGASAAERAIRVASALDRLDDAFRVADAYYFGRGFIIPDSNETGSSFSPEQRQTRMLFEPVTAPMRADPRFERLMRDIGFDRYWRESGVPPDYRRS